MRIDSESKSLVNPFIAAFENAEAGFFCVRDREGFRNFGGAGSGDHFTNGFFAEGAGLEFRAIKGTAQLKPSAAGFAGIPLEDFVFIDGHGQKSW